MLTNALTPTESSKSCRLQVDLVESSKSFHGKHRNSVGHLQGELAMPEGHQQQQRRLQSQETNEQTCGNAVPQLSHWSPSQPKSGLLDWFRRAPAPCSRCAQYNEQPASASLAGAQSCAFRNPYFAATPAAGVADYSNNSTNFRVQPQLRNDLLIQAVRPTESAAHGDHLQLHIASHIANLHNRQVTSSVKELTVLAGGDATPSITGNVVDLTDEEERARILANPREGDLIAVDLTGHDIIGLGFDVCGSERDGIFVRSVQARGPARQSGCMEPGDRIQCLNINFDQVTLQDARNILNCAAPYRMRLLIEKRLGGLPGRGTGNANPSQHQERPTGATGPLTCLRRLVSAGSFSSQKNYSSSGQDGSDHQHLGAGSAQQSSPPLGSAAARHLLESCNIILTQEGGYTNEAFAGCQQEAEPQTARSRLFPLGRSRSVQPVDDTFTNSDSNVPVATCSERVQQQMAPSKARASVGQRQLLRSETIEPYAHRATSNSDDSVSSKHSRNSDGESRARDQVMVVATVEAPGGSLSSLSRAAERSAAVAATHDNELLTRRQSTSTIAMSARNNREERRNGKEPRGNRSSPHLLMNSIDDGDESKRGHSDALQKRPQASNGC